MKCNVVFDFVSPHNGEYWYKCTACGASDWFAYYDKPARDKRIKGCKYEKDEEMITKKKYIVFYDDQVENAKITDDPVKLFLERELDPEKDIVWELGPQVRMEIKFAPSTPVLRDSKNTFRTTFENRD